MSLSWLLAITEAGLAVQGAPHARALAAALAAGGILAAWGAAWAAAGRNPFGRWRPGERPDHAPRRLIAARVALVGATIMTALMAATLPVHAISRDVLSAAIAFGAVAIASLVAAVFITRRAPYGRWIAIALGIYGLGMAVWRLPSMLPVIGPDAGPGPVVLLLIVGSVWAALVFAAICVLSLRDAWPENTASAHTPRSIGGH